MARYRPPSVWRVIVNDAGFQATGYAIIEHIQSAYGTDMVEHVVSIHPDNDHISGLRSVLAQLNVQNLNLRVMACYGNKAYVYH
jgi:beta-lactamase superfamily II metal-dependent hydrolase